jgi:rRNA-processing protein EBP2
MQYGAASDDDSSEDEGMLNDDELRARLASGQLKGAGYASSGSKYLTVHKAQLDEVAIEAKLKEIGALDRLGWAETMLVAAPDPSEEYKPNDDFARENAFYEQALAVAVEARRLLKQHKIPVQRPTDFYAEMLKTDEHMRHIKEKLVQESKKIEASERARKQRDNVKYGKKVQQEVLLKRQQAKTEAISETTKLRKGLQQKMDNNADFDVTTDDPADRKDRKSSAAKRKGKDAKFGFGGAKNNSRSKRNDSSSFLNAAGKGDKFSVKQNKTPFAGTAGKKKKTANSRPGKSKRAGGGRR